MQSFEIREKFLQFFESKKHPRIRSSSLIPESDPTLFFTNAGMVQFKNAFLGHQKMQPPRAVTSQKCMRVSGKHNDLENVGRTHRHHTFFEMLGNFSFGDYFKKEAIAYAWEFLTQTLRLDPNRLWITVFENDDEAAEIWEQQIGIPKEKIVRLGEKDNFWSMGEEGPCGPCSEIHFDQGINLGCRKKDCRVGCECERFTEIWNLVFMQYNREASSELHPLPKPSVDTGMGLERLSAVVQGHFSNYESDLFMPLIAAIEAKLGVEYLREKDFFALSDPQKKEAKETVNISIRVLADHIRAAVFLIGDGIQPANEGRGYVLRRILRRAMRHGRLLGMKQAFFYELAPILIDQMENAYPELRKHEKFIVSVIFAEENRFIETLEKGLEMIQTAIAEQKQNKSLCLPGQTVFRLYDTYGFPVDLIQNIADEEGLTVDMAGFEEAMLGQKETARRSWKGSGQERVASVYQELHKRGLETEFLGYESLKTDAKILALIRNGEEVRDVKEGDEIQIIVDRTPFYGESGGQVGDVGTLKTPEARLEISDTQKPIEGLLVHFGTLRKGRLKVGETAHLEVDSHHRVSVQLNHTATHLLHAALRKILGDHVRQAGSLVAADRLRFDFSHFEPLTEEVLEQLEYLVNEKIRANLPVEKREMSYDEAIQKGAMALFGEKYGDRVRVLKMDDFSIELCGGTHVDLSGQIGFFKIIQESSVAAGVRRIEAVTGSTALAYCRRLEKDLKQIAVQLKVGVEAIPDRLEKWAEQLKRSEKEIANLKAKLVSGKKTEDYQDLIKQKKGLKLLTLKSDAEDMDTLRALSDQVIQSLGIGLALVSAVQNGRLVLILRVSKDLTQKYKAGEMIKSLAALIDGSGGGRPDMAQAGGTKIDRIDQVFETFYQMI